MLGLSGHYRYGLIAAGQQNAHMVTAGLGAILAMILLLVGYHRAGPTGAAIGLFAAEVVVWWGAWWCSRHMLGLKGHARLLIRPLLVAALVSVVLWSPVFTSWIVRTVVGATVFAVLALMSDVELRDRFCQLVTRFRCTGSLAGTSDTPTIWSAGLNLGFDGFIIGTGIKIKF